jgi:soluble lytic murein transglycosylase-like protein
MSWEAVIQWKSIVDKYVAMYGIVTEAEIFAYIATESSGDPNKMNVHDPSFGLGSIEFAVALEWSDPPVKFETKADMDKLFDPDFNIQVLTKYASHLKAQFGADNPNLLPDGTPNPRGFAGSYNMGPTAFANGHSDLGYVQLWTIRYAEVQQAMTSAGNNG